jgi:hypothetical protein
MSDHETITLVGGPASGQQMQWDGGDMLEVAERPPCTFKNASAAFATLMATKHLYRRDPVERDVFRWQSGESAG